MTSQGRDPRTGADVRKWIDAMANHGAIIRKWANRIGLETVEQFIDACLSLENLIDPQQPFLPKDTSPSSSEEQDLFFRLQASGEEGEIEEILLELDGSLSMALPVSLKAGYSCIFDGSGNLLLYDNKGSLKKKYEVEWGQAKLDTGSHTLRVSCDYSSDADLELQGMVKLKERVEVISSR